MLHHLWVPHPHCLATLLTQMALETLLPALDY